MKTFLLSYTYVPDMVERRQPHRADHLAFWRKRFEDGKLLIAAALTDPVDSAVIVVDAENAGEVLALAGQDPYAQAGLIREAGVRELAVAIGPGK